MKTEKENDACKDTRETISGNAVGTSPREAACTFPHEAACEKFLDAFLQLDKHERVPLSLTFHLLTCKKCRRIVRLLTLAEKAAAKPLNVQTAITDETIVRVMKNIAPEIPEEQLINPIKIHNWIIGGILMIVFMITMIPILTAAPHTKILLLEFCIVFGAIVTAYCILFITSNMDFFIKQFELKTDVGIQK